MRRTLTRAIHPIACCCRRCSPGTPTNRRIDFAIRSATRALLLIAALIAIPFIIAHALASARGDQR